MWLPRILPLALFLPLGAHFFESFPNGWDQAEYVWCAQAGMLPHSPYVLYVFVGRALALLLPPAFALSLLSFAAGIAALVALAELSARAASRPGETPHEARWRGAIAAALLAGSAVFVRQATTQEVYAPQLATALCAAVLATSRPGSRRAVGTLGARNAALSGAVFGCAIGVHNASIFLAPAFLALVASPGADARSRVRALAAFAGAAVLTLAAVYAVVAALIPAAPGARLAELLVYLRGLPPGIDPGSLALPGFALDSLRGILTRLVDGEIPVSRGPLATGPVGLSWLTLPAAALGFALLCARARATALFWALWCAPFLGYELALGSNLDYGTYLVFVMPPVCALAAEAASLCLRLPRAGAGVAAALTVALLVPSLSRLADHWGDPSADRREHDSAATLAALFAAESLPRDAIVVQPRGEWNANLLPLHSGRRHVARSGAGLRIVRELAPWTPMRPDSYEPLTTGLLRELLRAGRPVIAFEPDPLAPGRPGVLEPGAFAWEPIDAIDLGAAAVRAGFAQPGRFAGRALRVYRAKEVASSSSRSDGSSSSDVSSR